VRDKLKVAVSIAEEDAKDAALQSSRVAPHIEGKNVSRVIYVPGKLVNVVAR
jgi:leucyl-tRNA synthetase